MGLFDRVERRLEGLINGAFARAFKAEVQPVEIASAMRRAMDDRSAVLAAGRTVVPNVFVVELAASDHDRLVSYRDLLADELVASAEEHAESQRYTPGGPFVVSFAAGGDLETGVFRVHASADKHASAQRHGSPDGPAQAPLVRNSPRPPEAVAAPEGPVNVASQAASAARNAMAGTAAARDAEADVASASTGVPPVALPSLAPPAPPVVPAPVMAPPAVPPIAPPPVAAPHVASPPVAASPVPAIDLPVADPAAGPVGVPAEVVPPSVDAAQRPWLDIDGYAYPLLLAITILGRDPSADVTLDDPGISRRHAELRVTHDGPHYTIALRDLGSTNGTYLNGERITYEHLSDGDRITMGRTSMHVRVGRR